MKTNRIIKTGVIAALALMFSVSCEDDSLPDTGSIADLNLPDADFFVTDSNSSALIKNITNSTRRGSTSVLWTLPEGAEFTFNEQGVLTTETDDEIVVRFPAVIEDPDDPDLGYLVGIEAFDDNGASSGLTFINVLVKSDPSRVLSSPSFTFEDGVSNFERIFTNTSANASGGVFWSVFQDGVELDIDELLDTSNFNFLNQTRFSEEVSLSFPGAGDYDVFVTGINFNGFETISEPQTVTILNLEPPVPSFTFSSNEGYTIQTFVNTTPDTDSVLWSLPGGSTLVNGSELTDETIQVSFSSSGQFTIGLQVTSIGRDEDGNEIILESADENESIEIAVINSIAEIPTPTIIAGDFEADPDNLTEEGLARFLGDDGLIDGENGNPNDGNRDASKEYWIADRVTSRAFIPGTTELYPAFPGATNDDVDWFETGEFNRVRITSRSRSGIAAASWDPGDERVVVQYIEVVPGVDYRVTFYYSNDSNSTDIGLLGLILDENVVTESQLSEEGSVLASTLAIEQTSGYVQETILFTNDSPDREAIKLYFKPSDNAGDYRLDDISIAID